MLTAADEGVVFVGVNDVLRDEPGRVSVLCNEAMVRADVEIVSAYPGSPTTETLETCAGASM